MIVLSLKHTTKIIILPILKCSNETETKISKRKLSEILKIAFGKKTLLVIEFFYIMINVFKAVCQ